VIFTYEIEEEWSDNDEESNTHQENRLYQEILQKDTLVACNATIKGQYIAGY